MPGVFFSAALSAVFTLSLMFADVNAEDANVNASRGNKYYDDSDPTDRNYHNPAHAEASLCTSDTDSWEPPASIKGDLARSMFYMAIRYTGDKTNEPALYLTDNTALIKSTNSYMGKLRTLLAWHKADPVSVEEIARQEKIYTLYQHNRNPLIDHPEWVDLIFTAPSTNPPTISDIAAQTTDEDKPSGPITFTVGDAETAAADLIVSGTSSNTNLVSDSNILFSGTGTNRAVTITPAANQFGSATITVSVTDSAGSFSSAAFTLTVNWVNGAPEANSQSLSLPEDTAQAILLNGSDVDGNPLTFAITTGPASGVISGFDTNTGALTYTPNTNFNGADRFTFQVNDGLTDSGVATVNLMVVAAMVVAAPPVIQSIAASGDNVTITWTAVAGMVYQVEYKSDLPASTWNVLPGDVTASADSAAKVDVTASTPRRFYRIAAVP